MAEIQTQLRRFQFDHTDAVEFLVWRGRTRIYETDVQLSSRFSTRPQASGRLKSPVS